eukprot:672070-Pyramimonas_sp.AAC.1
MPLGPCNGAAEAEIEEHSQIGNIISSKIWGERKEKERDSCASIHMCALPGDLWHHIAGRVWCLIGGAGLLSARRDFP